MGNKIALQSAGVDFTKSQLMPRFLDGALQDERWRVEDLEVGLGPMPSRAIVVIRTTAGVVDQAANMLAFNFDDYYSLMIGTRCCVNKMSKADQIPNPFADGQTVGGVETLFVGSVTNIVQDREQGNDAICCVLQDDRWLLQEIRVIGRWVFDPNNPTGPWFQMGWPAHFNPGGRPNCIFYNAVSTNFASPFFAPFPDWGLADGEEPPDPLKRSEQKATYWTLGTILEYLRNMYSWDGFTSATQTAKFPFIAKTPTSLIWPQDFGSGLDATAQANFNNAVGQSNQNTGEARKGREIILEGMSILDAIHMLLTTAGGWTIGFSGDVSQAADGSNVIRNYLSCERTRYLSDKDAATIPIALGGLAKDNLNRAVITSGTFEEDGSEFKSATAGGGQIVFIERRLSTAAADGSQLQVSHTSDRWNQFLTLAAGNDVTITRGTGEVIKVTGLGAASQLSFIQACENFPEVMTNWRINYNYDFQAGTDASGYPRAQMRRPFLPTQLTTIGDAGAFDFAGMKAPIYVEINTGTIASPIWSFFGQFDSLEVLDDGNIYLPILRDLNAPVSVWAPVDPANPWGVTGGKLNITLRDIRMNLVIPCDHRLSHFVYTANDPMPAGGAMSTNSQYNDNPDSDRIVPQLKRRDYKDLQELYACWLRAQSYSRPASQGWTQDVDRTQADPANIPGPLRSDLPLLKGHLKKAMADENRLKKSGELKYDGYIVSTWRPGMQVKELVPLGLARSNIRVAAVIGAVHYVNTEDRLYTGLKFL